jgi:hypothetical protein
VEKVFVLAYQGQLARLSVAADFGVGRLRESNIQNVTALVAARGDEAREGRGELVVYQKPHDAFRIG